MNLDDVSIKITAENDATSAFASLERDMKKLSDSGRATGKDLENISRIILKMRQDTSGAFKGIIDDGTVSNIERLLPQIRDRIRTNNEERIRKYTGQASEDQSPHRPSIRGAIEGVEEANGSIFGAFRHNISEHGVLRGSAGSALGIVGEIASEYGTVGAAAYGLQMAFGLLTDVMKNSNDAVIELQRNTERLSVTMKATGNLGASNGYNISELSEGLEKNTFASQSDLANTNRRAISSQMFDATNYNRVIKASNEIAEMTGQNLPQSEKMLETARQNPFKSVSSFRSAGIYIADADRNQIHLAQTSGNLDKAFNILLSTIERTTNNIAESSHKGVAGTQDEVSKDWEQAYQSIGQSGFASMWRSISSATARGITGVIRASRWSPPDDDASRVQNALDSNTPVKGVSYNSSMQILEGMRDKRQEALDSVREKGLSDTGFQVWQSNERLPSSFGNKNIENERLNTYTDSLTKSIQDINSKIANVIQENSSEIKNYTNSAAQSIRDASTGLKDATHDMANAQSQAMSMQYATGLEIIHSRANGLLQGAKTQDSKNTIKSTENSEEKSYKTAFQENIVNHQTSDYDLKNQISARTNFIQNIGKGNITNGLISQQAENELLIREKMLGVSNEFKSDSESILRADILHNQQLKNSIGLLQNIQNLQRSGFVSHQSSVAYINTLNKTGKEQDAEIAAQRAGAEASVVNYAHENNMDIKSPEMQQYRQLTLQSLDDIQAQNMAQKKIGYKRRIDYAYNSYAENMNTEIEQSKSELDRTNKLNDAYDASATHIKILSDQKKVELELTRRNLKLSDEQIASMKKLGQQYEDLQSKIASSKQAQSVFSNLFPDVPFSSSLGAASQAIGTKYYGHTITKDEVHGYQREKALEQYGVNDTPDEVNERLSRRLSAISHDPYMTDDDKKLASTRAQYDATQQLSESGDALAFNLQDLSRQFLDTAKNASSLKKGLIQAAFGLVQSINSQLENRALSYLWGGDNSKNASNGVNGWLNRNIIGNNTRSKTETNYYPQSPNNTKISPENKNNEQSKDINSGVISNDNITKTLTDNRFRRNNSSKGHDWWNDPVSAPYHDMIDSSIAKYGQGDPLITRERIANQIGMESSFDPNNVNPDSGATGLAQILASTAKSPGYGVKPVTNRKDPAQSIDFMVAYDHARGVSAYSGGGYNNNDVDAGKIGAFKSQSSANSNNKLGHVKMDANVVQISTNGSNVVGGNGNDNKSFLPNTKSILSKNNNKNSSDSLTDSLSNVGINSDSVYNAISGGGISSIGTSALSSVASGAMSTIASEANSVAKNITPLLNIGGFFAEGGNMLPGGAGYVVGENGPELIVPRTASRVVSTDETKRVFRGMNSSNDSSSGNTNVHVHINTPDVASFMRSKGQLISHVKQAINSARS